MRGCLVGLLLVAACYTPSIPAEVPCSPGGQCPDGQMCTAGKCVLSSATLPPDAPITVVTDRDGDGVPDVSDNCRDTPNPDQGNEDADSFGDACDVCPQIADNAQADTDTDHIGDACDPNAGMPDTLWLFEGFHKGMPAWPGSTNWTATGDKLRVVAPGNTANDGGYLVLPLSAPGRLTFDNFRVTATVLIEQMTGSNGDHSVGLSVFDDNVQKELDCDLDQGNGGAGASVFLDSDNGIIKQQTFAWTTGIEYRLTVTRHGGNYSCSVAVGAGMPVTAAGTSTLTPRTGADMEIWAYGVTAVFGSVHVAGTP